ncbi:unnamed protein product [Oikopleura dioica]|uniref:Uncharacterized protein n=1 Tax=Oikopleura dioica TaxID=34765 RepID=E4YL69_OIKDI|nr:unnamed protein product [Oikopleura dioica]
MALDQSSKRIKLNSSEPCSICKKHVEVKIYELEDGHKFCHSCGINFLTKLATKAGESRRQARLFHDHLKDAEKITKEKIKIAKKIIRGGYHGHFDPDEYAVRFNITVLDETTVSDATTDSVY